MRRPSVDSSTTDDLSAVAVERFAVELLLSSAYLELVQLGHNKSYWVIIGLVNDCREEIDDACLSSLIIFGVDSGAYGV